MQYQGPQALDAILNYPMYSALVDAFVIPGKQNMSALTDMIAQIKEKSTVSSTTSPATQSLTDGHSNALGPNFAWKLP